MNKPATNNKRIKELNAELKVLQAKLVQANKLEGKDAYIDVKVNNNQGRFEKIKQKGKEDKVLGKFYIEIEINAKQVDVFIPLSIASGKKTAGFMYQIEGTAEGSIVSAEVRVRGAGVTQVTLGTLQFARIPSSKIATFEIRATIKGKIGKVYKLVFTRLNYKLSLAETIYKQYLKEIHSDKVSFS
jgi:hypothetical protein